MRRNLGFTLTLIIGLLAILLVLPTRGIGSSQSASAAELDRPAYSLATGDGGPLGPAFTIRDDSSLEEVNPAVAYNPDREEYLVVWYNNRAGCDDIRGQRVSKEGGLVGGAFYISSGCDDNRRNPAVVCNSQQGEYLVVWEVEDGMGFNGIHGRLVSGNGEVQGTSDIEIKSTGSLYTPAEPAVAYASSSGKYLVVWSETWHPSPLDKDIVGQVVSASGALDGGNFTISDDTGSGKYRESPDVAYCRSRNEYLVVWRQRYSAGDYDIYARRVTGDGNPQNPPSVNISSLGSDEEDPAVGALPITTNQGDYLVAWEVNPGSDRGILAKTVHIASDGSATLGLQTFVANTGEDEINPAVAGTESGRWYLVTWKQPYEVSLGGGLWLVYQAIVGRGISSDGDLLTDDPAFIGGVDATHGAVAAGALGDFLVAFDDEVSDSGIYGRLWGNRVYLPLVLRNT